MPANEFSPDNPFAFSPDNPFANVRPAAPSSTAVEVFGREAAGGFTNALLAAPRGIGNVLAAGGAVPEGLFAKMRGEPFDFGRHYQQGLQELPASAFQAIPAPRVEQIAAGMRSVPALLPGGESPQAAYARNLDAIAFEQEQRRAEHPMAAAVGGVAGDVAALIGGRAPIASAVRRAEAKLLPEAPALYFGGAAPRAFDPGIKRTLDRALNAQLPRRLARGAGRSLEAGVEGAILEIVKGDNPDPLETAALASGGQMAGSLFLEGGKGLLSGGPVKAGLKVSLAAGSIAGMWQLVKSTAPGGRDRILESIESGFDKVALAIMLGAVSTVAGAPRYRSTKLAEELPMLVDGLAAVPRGATLSLLTDFVKAAPEEQTQFETVLNNLARDPSYQGRTAVERKIVSRIRGTSARGVIQRGGLFGTEQNQ